MNTTNEKKSINLLQSTIKFIDHLYLHGNCCIISLNY